MSRLKYSAVAAYVFVPGMYLLGYFGLLPYLVDRLGLPLKPTSGAIVLLYIAILAWFGSGLSQTRILVHAIWIALWLQSMEFALTRLGKFPSESLRDLWLKKFPLKIAVAFCMLEVGWAIGWIRRFWNSRRRPAS